MNLQKIYTCHGAMWIDADQIARCNAGDQRRLTIYTARGNRASVTAKTQAERDRFSAGCHYANIFASQELADQDRERIYADMAKRNYSEARA